MTATSAPQSPATYRSAAPTERLLMIEEAAEMLRVPVSTLRYWRHRGCGPVSFHLGRRVFYRHDDLLDWVGAQRDLDIHSTS